MIIREKYLSKITIYNYLEYMCRALLINKAERYDVRGKRILNGKYKYYLSDLGLGQVVNKERNKWGLIWKVLFIMNWFLVDMM